jgi:drug/metabolite transporter (DMT)-like permease
MRHMVGCMMLMVAMCFLGSSFIAAKFALNAFPDAMALFIRLAIATAILVPVSHLFCEPGNRLDGKTWALIVIQAVVGIVLLNLLLFRGLSGAPASTAGVLFGLLPIVVALMSAVLLQERLSLSSAFAALLAAAGSMFFCTGAIGGVHLDGRHMEAILLIVLAVLCAGCFTVVGKLLARKISPFRIAALVSVSGLVITTPLAAGEIIVFEYEGVSQAQWMSVLWWSISSGVLYAVFLYAGLSRVDAVYSGIFTIIVPLTTLLLSYVFLAEVISLSQCAGMICAFAGILLVFWSTREESLASLLQSALKPSAGDPGAGSAPVMTSCRNRSA